jgi:hypothetical protein
MKKSKPIINVSQNVTTRRSYTLTDGAARILEEYARFLSDHVNFRVSPGEVVSKLVLKLCRDELFMEWQRESSGKKLPSKGQKSELSNGGSANV